MITYYNPYYYPNHQRPEISYFSGENVDGWLYELECFFYRYRTTVEQKLAIATSYLAGDAIEWYRQWCWDMRLSWRIGTWDDFVADLRCRFRPEPLTRPSMILESMSKTCDGIIQLLTEMKNENSVYMSNLSKLKSHVSSISASDFSIEQVEESDIAQTELVTVELCASVESDLVSENTANKVTAVEVITEDSNSLYLDASVDLITDSSRTWSVSKSFGIYSGICLFEFDLCKDVVGQFTSYKSFETQIFAIKSTLSLCLSAVCENASMSAPFIMDGMFVKPPAKPPEDRANKKLVSILLDSSATLDIESSKMVLSDENPVDLSVYEVILTIFSGHSKLRQKELSHEAFQWFIHRMMARFATDDNIVFLKGKDPEHILFGGHKVMVQGCYLVLKAFAENAYMRLNLRVTKIFYGSDKVMTIVEGGMSFVANTIIITVLLGILKANLIEFEPNLLERKIAAIFGGVWNEQCISLRSCEVFWTNEHFLGVVAFASTLNGYFPYLNKGTGQPIVVYMGAERFAAYDLQKLSDEDVVKFGMLHLAIEFLNATKLVHYLVTDWGANDPNSFGSSYYYHVGKFGKVGLERGSNIIFYKESTNLQHDTIIILVVARCTNPSNLGIVCGTALVNKKAWEFTLKFKPWLQTRLTQSSDAFQNYGHTLEDGTSDMQVIHMCLDAISVSTEMGLLHLETKKYKYVPHKFQEKSVGLENHSEFIASQNVATYGGMWALASLKLTELKNKVKTNSVGNLDGLSSTRKAIHLKLANTSNRTPQRDWPLHDPYGDALTTTKINNYQGVVNEDYKAANTPVAKPLDTVEDHVKSVLALSFPPFEYYPAIGGEDITNQIWDLRMNKSMYIILARSNLISHVRHEPQERFLVVAPSPDMTTRDDIQVKTFLGYEVKVTLFDIIGDEHDVITVSHDSKVKAWSTRCNNMSVRTEFLLKHIGKALGMWRCLMLELVFERTFIWSLLASIFTWRCMLIFFSSPRPPELVDLEDKVIFMGEGMLRTQSCHNKKFRDLNAIY